MKKSGNMRFVNKDGISTDELREMVDKYSALKITEKNSIKEQLGCHRAMPNLEFLTYIRQNSLHRKFMDLLGM